jgi:hypothetical protein
MQRQLQGQARLRKIGQAVYEMYQRSTRLGEAS